MNDFCSEHKFIKELLLEIKNTLVSLDERIYHDNGIKSIQTQLRENAQAVQRMSEWVTQEENRQEKMKLERKEDKRDSSAFWFGVIGSCIGVLSLIVMALEVFKK